MFLRKLLLSCLTFTLSSAVFADELTEAPVAQQAAPNFNTCAKPIWPQESLRRGLTGAVTLKFLISPDGRVEDAAITRSSGHVSLDEAAVEGIRKCKFTPGKNAGKAVRAWMQLQYVWTLVDTDTRNALINDLEQYRQAALKGDIDALYQLGKGYMKLDPVEHGPLAVRMFQAAAQQEHVGALFELSKAYRYGNGTPRNEELAVSYERQAAEMGFAGAQLARGWRYKKGGDGEKRDPQYAAAWFRKAADQGDQDAQNALGEMYAAGEGVAADPVEAVKWFQKAATSGHVDAQRYYGLALLIGRGTERDFKAAATWLRKAADKRDPIAEGTLATLWGGDGLVRESRREGQ